MAAKRRPVRAATVGVLSLALCLAAPAAARANPLGDIIGGVGEIVSGAVSLPLNVIVGTFTGPPVVGTLQGALVGTLQTLTMTTRGALHITRGTVPILFKILPFAL